MPRSPVSDGLRPTKIISMLKVLRFAGAVERDPAVAAWFDTHPGELRALAEPWFDRMRRCGPDVRELMHDGLATACVGDIPFAYVGIFAAHVTLGFFHGATLPDPAGLLQGAGRYMRHVKLEPDAPFDDSALAALITAAHRDAGMRLLFADGG
jgi:hypothetical protein